MRVQLGRHVLGLAAIGFGLLALSWRDFNVWQQIHPLGPIAHRDILLYVIGVAEILGGLAIQWRKTARAGAVVLAIVYLFFGILWLPLYIEKPIFDRLANFFEQFSMVCGALIVYATTASTSSRSMARLARAGYYCFALCVVSFTLDQLFYLHATADFVPKWIPPGQMFWAIVTTIAFALAAIALFSGRCALLASRLLTLMIVLFGLLIWIPAPFADPHSLTAWGGIAENFGIGGAAWIVADYLRFTRPLIS
jgi:uncharacterized membrane protein YphA (DoxX/SURF4 family)